MKKVDINNKELIELKNEIYSITKLIRTNQEKNFNKLIN